MPNIGTSPGTHLLDASLYFLPNSCQVVYVELLIKTIHILPPPPLLSSCLAPLAHRYCPRHRFCCSLLIVDCPRHSHCRHLCHRRYGLTADPLPTVVVMIVVVVTVAAVVVVIVVIVPVAVVDNNVKPGPRCSLRRQLSLSLLFRCFLRRHCRCLRGPLLPPSMWSLFLQLLPLTSRHGHDLLLRKSLF
jgi:hypothetical protein